MELNFLVYLRCFIVLLLLSILAACNGETESQGSSSSSSSNSSTSSNSSSSNSSSSSSGGELVEDNKPQCEAEKLPGRQLWLTQCANCHGDRNQGNAFAAVVSSDRETMISYVASSMPLGKSELCDSDCATSVADYLIAYRQEACANIPLEGRTLFYKRPALESLHSIAFNLTSRLPTQTEIEQVSTGGEYALATIVDSLMTEDAFADRIMEIYGDEIQVEQFTPTHGHSGALLNITFEEEGVQGWWYDQYGERDYIDHVNIIRAHAREPLQLIKHVVQQGKDFREILTADYVMVNNLNKFTYKPYETEQFAYKDIGEYQPFYETQRPRIGILGTVGFIYKFASTDVNRNRKRASAVYDIFLDTDIKTLGGAVIAAADAEAATDILSDPNCKSCHSVMDPVASAFKHYNALGIYRPMQNWHDDMSKPGFGGVSQPDGDADEPLRWVAERISDDPRFARATVRTLFEGLVGQEVIRLNADSLPEQIALYSVQQEYLAPWAKLFIDSNYNIRELVKAMVLSDYYQAAMIIDSNLDLFIDSLNEDQKEFVKQRIGGASLFTPEMLARKIKLLTNNESWGDTINLFDGFLDPINVENGLGVLYGGIDFKDNTKRLRDLNGFMLAIQERMSYDVACEMVANEFFQVPNQREYFEELDLDVPPELQTDQLKEIIVELIWTTWGKVVDVQSDEVSIAYDLLVAIYQENLRLGQPFYECHFSAESGRHLKMAMVGVVSYLLGDYRFNNL